MHFILNFPLIILDLQRSIPDIPGRIANLAHRIVGLHG
jgi:hypothetical protein